MRIDENGYLDDDYMASQDGLSKPLIDIAAKGVHDAMRSKSEYYD
jgi:hypothetical protein